LLNQQNLNHDGIYSCTGIYFFKSARFVLSLIFSCLYHANVVAWLLNKLLKRYYK
jgi:hypothetical protein